MVLADVVAALGVLRMEGGFVVEDVGAVLRDFKLDTEDNKVELNDDTDVGELVVF